MPQPLCQHNCCLNSVSFNRRRQPRLPPGCNAPVCTKAFGLLWCELWWEHPPPLPRRCLQASPMHTPRRSLGAHGENSLGPIQQSLQTGLKSSQGCELARNIRANGLLQPAAISRKILSRTEVTKKQENLFPAAIYSLGCGGGLAENQGERQARDRLNSR